MASAPGVSVTKSTAKKPPAQKAAAKSSPPGKGSQAKKSAVKISTAPAATSPAQTPRSPKPIQTSNGASELGQLWTSWGALTRFLESARLAFARERDLWTSLELDRREDIRIQAPAGRGSYNVSLDQHLMAVQDEQTLYKSVLLHSYALAEAAALDHLHLTSRSTAGIEEWGSRLLSANGRHWQDVSDGLAGAVEVAVARNACAHGNQRIDARVEARLRRAGVTKWVAGSCVTISYEELRDYRHRLRSLLGAGGVGQQISTPAVPTDPATGGTTAQIAS